MGSGLPGALIRRIQPWCIRAARRLLGPHAVVSYSQEGEDRILARILEGSPAGFYVDVGAHDPRRFSNTYLLYLAGWHGIVVDPMVTVESFGGLRPRDIVVCMAVGSEQGERCIYLFNDPALNTLSADRAELLAGNTPFRLIGTQSVAVDRLDAILARHVPTGEVIDVLTIDVEGLDEEVLRSNDWQRFRPRVVIVEVLAVESLDDVLKSPTARYLASVGYGARAMTVNSAFFVDRRQTDSQPAVTQRNRTPTRSPS